MDSVFSANAAPCSLGGVKVRFGCLRLPPWGGEVTIKRSPVELKGICSEFQGVSGCVVVRVSIL